MIFDIEIKAFPGASDSYKRAKSPFVLLQVAIESISILLAPAVERIFREQSVSDWLEFEIGKIIRGRASGRFAIVALATMSTVVIVLIALTLH
jgi:hypothetical protein